MVRYIVSDLKPNCSKEAGLLHHTKGTPPGIGRWGDLWHRAPSLGQWPVAGWKRCLSGQSLIADSYGQHTSWTPSGFRKKYYGLRKNGYPYFMGKYDLYCQTHLGSKRQRYIGALHVELQKLPFVCLGGRVVHAGVTHGISQTPAPWSVDPVHHSEVVWLTSVTLTYSRWIQLPCPAVANYTVGIGTRGVVTLKPLVSPRITAQDYHLQDHPRTLDACHPLHPRHPLLIGCCPLLVFNMGWKSSWDHKVEKEAAAKGNIPMRPDPYLTLL